MIYIRGNTRVRVNSSPVAMKRFDWKKSLLEEYNRLLKKESTPFVLKRLQVLESTLKSGV